MKPRNDSLLAQEFMEKGHSRSCPIIDMHGHYGEFGAQWLPVSNPKLMRRSLKRSGVKRIVCSSFEALFGNPDLGNKLLQQGIRRFPDTFLGYWSVNPNISDSSNRAAKDFEKASGFVGFKFLPDYHTYPVTGRKYVPVLKHADERNLIVLVHTWRGSSFDSPQMLAEVAVKYPGATFLMGHSGYGDWENSVRLAAEIPNLYLELTAVYVAHDFANQPGGSGTPLPFLSCVHTNGIIEYMVEEASSQKVLFGTDMPWFSPHFAAGAVLFARINDEERRDIFYRNAERLLKNLII